MIVSHDPGYTCSWLGRDDSVTTYCFGELTEEERYRFEAHLIECSSCWQEVQRLDALVKSIQRDRTLTRQFDAEIVGAVGISSNVPQRFFGHAAHCIAASAIYAAALATTVFMELAYEYPVWAKFAWTTAPLVFLGVFATTLIALVGDSTLTRSGRRSGLLLAITILLVAAAANYGLIGSWLPTYSVTQASFRTWTAQAAYLKGIMYCAIFASFFLLTPFHFAIALQRELWSGRYRNVNNTLTGGRLGVPPRGAPYLGVWLLGGLLALGAVSSVISTAHLLEALVPSLYTNLFILTIIIRWLLFLVLGVECCWWYYSVLNEMKREAVVALNIAGCANRE